MDMKTKLLAALMAFARQRPGLEPAVYGSWAAYRSESRGVTRDLHIAERLANSVYGIPEITAEHLLHRSEGTRLSLSVDDTGNVKVDYCAGQSYSVEYRAAVCQLLASVLWDAQHAACPTLDNKGLRASFRNWFGKQIADLFFD